jgi:protein-S-isoprenylcysteine O-methyltransferase Ste14
MVAPAVSAWRHVRAAVLLPGMVTVAVPGAIVALAGADPGWGLDGAPAALPVLAGAVVLCAGVVLWYRTVTLFARTGKGTLAPWDPTRKLVVLGPYRYVRNPMITGVLLVLAGEAALLGSPLILAWAAAFFCANALYFPRVEEPGLLKRFGSEYEEYRRHVPPWIPRRTPWTP